MFKFSRILVVYAIAVPLALMLGYLVVFSGPIVFLFLAALLGLFALPLFFRWHYGLMLFFWNASFVAFFLPGNPDLWIVFAAASFVISILNHIMFQKRFLRAPELTYPLLVLAVIVIATALYRGGLNIRALGGSSAGGRYYIYVLMAIAGYFAFTAQKTPSKKSVVYATVFFGSGMCIGLGDLALRLGIKSPIIYNLLPSQFALAEVMDYASTEKVTRLTSLAPAALAASCVLLVRYGLKGVLEGNKLWRPTLALVLFGISLLGGFRSIIAFTTILFCFQFYYERLLHTRLLPIGIGFFIIALIPVFFFSRSMPAPVQRAISFLPVNVDPDIRSDATASTEWRLEMWAAVIKELPKYLIIGKGYGLNAEEMMVERDAASMGVATTVTTYDAFIQAGDYHSGPLSVLMPFGIFGFLTFLWMLISGYRVLCSNYRYGEPKLRVINAFLLSYFVTFSICFFFIFGALNSQLSTFLGICGLSVSLNGGVRRRQLVIRKVEAPLQKSLALSPI